MGFVKTDEEIASIQARLAQPRFLSAQLLTVRYLTRPEIVRHVLPPGLEPTEQPVATVMVGHWGRSNVCHAFSGACFYVQARHKQHVGDYCLAMQMSTDAAIIFGREVFGEPKKYAKTTLERSGNAFKGRVERYGNPIVRIDATMRKKDRIAVRRRFRDAIVLWRSFSKLSRKARTRSPPRWSAPARSGSRSCR
jgi:acetoacetate decarboxylase